MIANAALVAEPGQRYPRLRSQAPLVLRPTADGVYLVGGAAGPLGGDALTIEVEVRAGAHLTVRSAAASMVFPGPAPSVVSVRAHVGKGASLRWLPEPVVLMAGCRHRMEAVVDVDAGGRLEWREEILLGRHREPSGSAVSRLRIDYGDRPLLRQELWLGPEHRGWKSPAVSGAARAVGSVTVAGVPVDAAVVAPEAAVLALEGPGGQVVALAGDGRRLRALLEEGQRNFAQ